MKNQYSLNYTLSDHCVGVCKLEQFSIQHLSKTKVNTGQSQNTQKSTEPTRLNQQNEADIKCVLARLSTS